MRKIVTSDYKVKARSLESGDIIDAPYSVKESLVSVLFLPELQLSAVALLEQNKLANKIHDSKDGVVLLEDSEYERVEKAIKTVKGLGKNDVEFVRRILEAETVDVEEKTKGA